MHAFDPFNMSLSLSSLGATCIVFVDAESAPLVDRLPNLLRLKRDVRIMFRQFRSCDDVVQRTVACLFPRAGVVVLHHNTLLRCNAGMYKTVHYLTLLPFNSVPRAGRRSSGVGRIHFLVGWRKRRPKPD